MDVEKQSDVQMTKLAELIGEIKFAMFTTQEPDGTLRSRPLATMQMDAQGALWFFTGQSSPKVEEAMQHRQVAVSYAHPDRQDYVSVSGTAEIGRDRQKMQELWTPVIKPWFPNGLDDPDLVLLKVNIREAEYWEAPGNTVKRYYGLAKAIATGDTDGLGENEKIKVGG